MKAEFARKNGVFYANQNTGVCVAIMKAFPEAHTVRIGTSVMADDEPKFRKSVGAYYAISNVMCDHKFITLPDNGHDLEDMAQMFTELV